MAELGHSDPALSLRVYAPSMRYGEREREQLRRLIKAPNGSGIDGNSANGTPAMKGKRPEEPVNSGSQGA
jgi:hypothetical protein